MHPRRPFPSKGSSKENTMEHSPFLINLISVKNLSGLPKGSQEGILQVLLDLLQIHRGLVIILLELKEPNGTQGTRRWVFAH